MNGRGHGRIEGSTEDRNGQITKKHDKSETGQNEGKRTGLRIRQIIKKSTGQRTRQDRGRDMTVIETEGHKTGEGIGQERGYGRVKSEEDRTRDNREGRTKDRIDYEKGDRS